MTYLLFGEFIPAALLTTKTFMVRCRPNRGLDKPADVGRTEAKGSPRIQAPTVAGIILTLHKLEDTVPWITLRMHRRVL